MMQAAELSTTVGSIPKSLSDGSSSSFHVQKNKRTQTKSQVYRSVSEGSSDENEKLINKIIIYLKIDLN